MSVYVYAVLQEPAPLLLSLTGHDEAPVQLMIDHKSGLGVAVCWLEEEDSTSVLLSQLREGLMTERPLLMQAVAQHAAVLEVCVSAGACLPFPFPGPSFADPSDVMDRLRGHSQALTAELERIGNHVAFSIRFSAEAPPLPEGQADLTPGRKYLQQKMQVWKQQQAAARLANQFAHYAEGLFTEFRRTDPGAPGRHQALSKNSVGTVFLVPMSQEQAFIERLQAFHGEQPDGESISCTGPWPACEFLSEDVRKIFT